MAGSRHQRGLNDSRGHHGFSRSRVFACKDGCGLFRLDSGLRLIMESGNILCLRKLLHANSSTAEVKNKRVEAFACESFYLLLLFLYLLSCFYLLFLSFFSCCLRLIGPSTAQSYLPGNNILHIFILHTQIIKMGVTPSSHN